MDKNTEYYYKSAQHYFLPVEQINGVEGFRLKLGKRNFYFYFRDICFNNLSSARMAENKYFTNKILEKAAIPVPKAAMMYIAEYKYGVWEEKISNMQYPLVVKPTLDGLGRGVLCNVQNIEQLKAYLDTLFKSYDFVSIEEFHGQLKSYRILVFDKRVIGVIFREPAHVIGDGQHNIQELIELTNQKRSKNEILAPIRIDEECHFRLVEQGVKLDYIPKEKEKIKLGYTSNASRGGSFTALKTRSICRKNRQLMARIAELLNLGLVGVDIECEDIGIPLESSRGVILEVNHSPSIRIHEDPLVGDPNPVSRKIIRKLIFRHPFSYLSVLYHHRQTHVYVRSFILLSFLVILYNIVSRLISLS